MERVAQVVAETSDATLEELLARLRRQEKLRLSRTVLWRALESLRLTPKKEGHPRSSKRDTKRVERLRSIKHRMEGRHH